MASTREIVGSCRKTVNPTYTSCPLIHPGIRRLPPPQKKKSERPVDALAVKNVNYSLSDNLKSRDASASKKTEK